MSAELNASSEAALELTAATPAKSQGKNLLVNYASLLGGTVTAKGFALLTVLMLTRYLGIEDFGRYSLVFSYWALLNTLVDLGGIQILAREIAQDRTHPGPAIAATAWLRLLGCVIFLPLGFLLAKPLGLSQPLVLMIAVGILVGFEAYYDTYFSATMQLDKSAKARYFSSLANVTLIAGAILAHASLGVILLISLLNPLVKLWYDLRYQPFHFTLPQPEWARIGRIARDGWPLWLAGLQYILLTRIDTFLLQVLSPTGQHDLGIYAASYRFTEVMGLLINALGPALLPLLVTHMRDADKMRFLTGTGTRLIVSAVMLLSLGIFWFAPQIAAIYGPGYAESAGCMRILIWSQALVAINTLCYQLLIVYNSQGRKPVIITSALMTLLNIGLNVWLIPHLHAQGASWATVITEAVIVLTMLAFLRAYTPIRLARDLILPEALALLACLPGLVWGEVYGWLSLPFFAVLVIGLRVLTPAQLRQLAQERLHAAPPNPR